MASELIFPFRVTDSDGNPYGGAKFKFYETGTLTPQAVYSDADLENSLGAVVTADSGGKMPAIYLDSSKAYRGILENSSESITLYDIDPVNPGDFADLASPDSDKGSHLIAVRALGSEPAQAVRLDDWIHGRPMNVMDFYEEDDANDGVTLQRAIDKAANWASAGYARRLLLDRWFDIPETITLRPYVYLEGVGRGRSGLRPTSALTGPVLDMDSFGTGSSVENVVLSDLGINGTNATGAAYAMRIRGQKKAQFRMLGITNFLTTSHALQIVHNGYNLTFDGLWMYNCNKFLKGSRETVTEDTSFPTTVVFRSCVFEEGPNDADEEAFLLADCNSFLFHERCIFQSIKNRTTFLTTGGADRSTNHGHEWNGCYFEGNGNAHAGHSTWKLVGINANRVDGIKIIGNHMHGSGGGGGHIHATYTRGLVVRDNLPVPGQKWVTDGGNNDNYDIDPLFAGTCELQSTQYGRTTFQFDNSAALSSQDGPLAYTLTKNGTGEFYVDFVRTFTGVNDVLIQVNARDASVNGMFGQGYMSSTSRAIIRINDAATGAVLTDPTRCHVSIQGKLSGLS